MLSNFTYALQLAAEGKKILWVTPTQQRAMALLTNCYGTKGGSVQRTKMRIDFKATGGRLQFAPAHRAFQIAAGCHWDETNSPHPEILVWVVE